MWCGCVRAIGVWFGEERFGCGVWVLEAESFAAGGFC